MRLSLVIALAALGCAPGTTGTKFPKGRDDPDPVDTDTDTDTDVDTDDTDTDTDTEPLPTFDCSTVPEMPLSNTQLDAPRGYNDVVFDADGAMIGHDGNAFIKATSPTDATALALAGQTVYKMGYLDNGDVVAATDTGTIVRVTPAGATSVVASGINGYGLAIGSDGMIYVGTNYTFVSDGIVRIDPATGDSELWLDASAYPPRAIGFSRDFTVLYFGTLNGGDVYKVELDANLDPVGDPQLVVTLPAGWHDTLEVDACGNVYVGAFFTWSIYRINVDLSIDRILQWDFNSYGHGFEWGSADGGWNEQAIYVTHPYIGSRIEEVEIGVPGAHWVGEVIGGGTP